MLTAQGRQERAYERYVRKCSLGRVKQQKRFASAKSPMPVTYPSDSVMSAGPESVTEAPQ